MPTLVAHPSTPAGWLDCVSGEAAWGDNGGLRLVYRLQGELGRLKLPAAARREHTDGLWRHSCCEVFIQGVDGPAYREYNLSPSTAWAAYRFEDYRRGGERLAIAQLQIACDRTPSTFTLQASIDADSLPVGARLRLGLSMVVESMQGELSYWALRHVSERPDFHAAGGFALELSRT